MFNVVLNKHEHVWICKVSQLAGQMICEYLNGILAFRGLVRAVQNILNVLHDLDLCLLDRGDLSFLALWPMLSRLS